MGRDNEPVYRVLPRQVDITLAAALREWMPSRSWSQIRQLIRTRQIMISGNLCVDAGRRLKLQDVIKVLSHSAAPQPKENDVRIVYLDQHVVVVEKPSGITSVRHAEERDWPAKRRQVQPTLDEMLPRIIAKAQGGRAEKSTKHSGKSAGKNQRGQKSGSMLPVRAVHRIDRDTSGLMVFARTVKAERILGEQFRSHDTHRRYLAIVQGQVQSQTVTARLIRDRGDGRRGVTPSTELGKNAVTHITSLEPLGDYTLVRCQLETGRTHQIRIHLAHIGHPLCGEKVYRQPLFQKPIPDPSKAPRLALHAAELGFIHPVTGEKLQFSTQLPRDLDQFLHKLRTASK